MKFLFVFPVRQKDKFCCCSLKRGLITIAVLAIIFAGANFVFGLEVKIGRGKKDKSYIPLINALGVIIPIFKLITLCKINFSHSKVVTSVYNLYLFINTILVVFITFYFSIVESLGTEEIIFLVDMWIYLVFTFFVGYVFTVFTFNYH